MLYKINLIKKHLTNPRFDGILKIERLRKPLNRRNQMIKKLAKAYSKKYNISFKRSIAIIKRELYVQKVIAKNSL